MINKRAIDILRELLAAEDGSFASRLIESTLFVGADEADEDVLVRRIAREVSEHRSWLVDLLSAYGGMPGPRRGELRSADLHFLDVSRALPRLVANLEEVVRKYDAAAALLPATAPGAVATVARIGQRHRANLEALQKLLADRPAAA